MRCLVSDELCWSNGWHGGGESIMKSSKRKQQDARKRIKVDYTYTVSLVYGQDAWPSRCCRKATSYTSFDFGSIVLRRQLACTIYGFQGYGSDFWD